jgi:hypothetical protein
MCLSPRRLDSLFPVYRLEDHRLRVVRPSTSGTAWIGTKKLVVAELADLRRLNTCSRYTDAMRGTTHLHTTLAGFEVEIREVERFGAEDTIWIVLRVFVSDHSVNCTTR